MAYEVLSEKHLKPSADITAYLIQVKVAGRTVGQAEPLAVSALRTLAPRASGRILSDGPDWEPDVARGITRRIWRAWRRQGTEVLTEVKLGTDSSGTLLVDVYVEANGVLGGTEHGARICEVGAQVLLREITTGLQQLQGGGRELA